MDVRLPAMLGSPFVGIYERPYLPRVAPAMKQVAASTQPSLDGKALPRVASSHNPPLYQDSPKTKNPGTCNPLALASLRTQTNSSSSTPHEFKDLVCFGYQLFSSA